MTTYDVFSHASDDKPTVEALARRLCEDGLKPFLDKWHLVPGEPWHNTSITSICRDPGPQLRFLGAEILPRSGDEEVDGVGGG